MKSCLKREPAEISDQSSQMMCCRRIWLASYGLAQRLAIPSDDFLTFSHLNTSNLPFQCLAAGSSILNRETESAVMRPLAKALAKSLETVREQLREQCLRNSLEFPDKLRESLSLFDRLFAEFELSYVSAMVPVKTALEYNHQQDIIVLFSETLQRALSLGLLSQDLVDTCDPALMFTIPRLAIVCGLLVLPDGPLNLQRQLSELFRPFRNLLCKIRDLLWTLTSQELQLLEKALCSTDPTPTTESSATYPMCKADEYITKFHQDYPTTQRYLFIIPLQSTMSSFLKAVFPFYCRRNVGWLESWYLKRTTAVTLRRRPRFLAQTKNALPAQLRGEPATKVTLARVLVLRQLAVQVATARLSRPPPPSVKMTRKSLLPCKRPKSPPVIKFVADSKAAKISSIDSLFAFLAWPTNCKPTLPRICEPFSRPFF